jgi:hypothetical protein
MLIKPNLLDIFLMFFPAEFQVIQRGFDPAKELIAAIFWETTLSSDGETAPSG